MGFEGFCNQNVSILASPSLREITRHQGFKYNFQRLRQDFRGVQKKSYQNFFLKAKTLELNILPKS